jgi:hypothetical protein
MENDNSRSEDKSNEKDFEPGTLAIVQCEGFRCLASLDAKNIWRDFKTGEQLRGVKGVVVSLSEGRTARIIKNPRERE